VAVLAAGAATIALASGGAHRIARNEPGTVSSSAIRTPVVTKANAVVALFGANGSAPVARVNPAPGSDTAAPNGAITITFNHPVSKVLGGIQPTITPAVPGEWSQPGPNKVIFTPTGFGLSPDSPVTITFDRPVTVVAASASKAAVAQTAAALGYSFDVAPASMLRLEQILAQLQYLPLTFTPAPGVALPATLDGEVATMTQPLAGSFSWRWANTPASLQAQWTAGSANVLVQGALMDFDSVRGVYNGYQLERESVAQMADPATWQALLQAAAANQVDPNAYSYVSVTKASPETLSLWQNGAVILTSPTNTGIPSRPTEDGTFPIYVRYAENYMNGTNPNGTSYHDLVHWINYFNGGDAVHGFVRSSYGSPQSLGCVELPVATAQVAYSDLAIGDLVTVSG